MNIEEIIKELSEPEDLDEAEKLQIEEEEMYEQEINEAVEKILLNMESELEEFLMYSCCNKLDCLKRIKIGIEDFIADYNAYRKRIIDTVPPGRIARHYPELLN